MKPYPLIFKPLYKQRIWGGRRLGEVFGKEIPPGQKIGESWELADLPQDKSVILNGDLAGRTLARALEQFAGPITGNPHYKAPFPLLIKILDAQDILSVQVHPDSATCRRMGRGDMKTECWYIIDKTPDAFIYKGLKPGVSKEQFAEAIRSGTVDQTLIKVPVQTGECHFLPAGTPHSIGPGLLIAEIQTPSDTTYRVFDFNRVDDQGNSRQLHIEEAMESIHFDSSNDNLTVNTIGRLVDCEYFKVDKGHQARDGERLLPPGQMKIIIPLTGAGKIISRNDDVVAVCPGQTLLIPAAYEGAIVFGDDTEYLTVIV